MTIKNVGKWVTSLFAGAMLVVAPCTALAAPNNDAAVEVPSFNNLVAPGTTRKAPGDHSQKYKKADDDEDEGGDFDFGFGYGGPGWGGGWYGGPYWGPPAQSYYYTPRPKTGELKIETHHRNAQVYIDGAYAGTIRNQDKFALRPGSYQLQVRAANGESFSSQVYVTRGKTPVVRPDFAQAG